MATNLKPSAGMGALPRAIVVDDDPVVGVLVGLALPPTRWSVEVVASAGEAEQLVRRGHTDVVLNAIEHRAGLDPEAQVTVTRIRTDAHVVYLIRGPGPGFSREALPHAAVSNRSDDPTWHVSHRERLGLRAGGYGLLASRGIVDELVHDDQGNAVALIKRLRTMTTSEA
jgi:CheY-like chemotaxis protein